ncbi:MAG: HIT family protein [Spirochaetota bacterium]
MANLFNFNKLEYIKGRKKPQVDCILCALRDKNPDIVDLEITQTELSMVCVNLYPYNSGHIMIFPQRHIADFRELSDVESLDIEVLTRASIDIMTKLYNPSGFNIGFNIGNFSGASITHLHRHIIPRYPNELGFIDIVGGSKIIVEEPNETMEKLKEAFNDINLEDYRNK